MRGSNDVFEARRRRGEALAPAEAAELFLGGGKPLEQRLFDDIVGLLRRAQRSTADEGELRGEADRLWARLAMLLEQEGRRQDVQATRERIRVALRAPRS